MSPRSEYQFSDLGDMNTYAGTCQVRGLQISSIHNSNWKFLPIGEGHRTP